MSNRKPLYGWLTAEAISLTGTRVSMIAVPWLVLTTTGSPTKTGLVALAELLPLVLLTMLGGPIIDRVGARRISITCDLLSVVVVGAIPLVYDAGMMSFPVLLLLVAMAGALRGPSDGAKHAMVPALVEQAGVPMERATGLHSTVERTASMLGTGFAGGLVAVIGPANALVVDAFSFLLSAAVLAWSTRSLVKVSTPSTDESPDEAGYFSRLREGWDFLRHDHILFGIAVMVAFTNLIDIAYLTVLVPVWARDTGGGAAAVGLFFAVFSGASAVGALGAAAWGSRLPRYKTYLFAFLLCGAPRFIAMGLDSALWVVLTTAVIGGFASGFINPILGAVIFERIPAPLVGRVTSLSSAMCFALMPLGGVFGGLLVAGFGLSTAMLVAGTAYFLITMVPAVDRRWRDMDRRPATVESEPVRV